MKLKDVLLKLKVDQLTSSYLSHMCSMPVGAILMIERITSAVVPLGPSGGRESLQYVYSTLYIWAVHTVQYAQQCVYYELCTVNCAVYDVECALYIVYCALGPLHCMLCKVQCVVCCSLCPAYCAVYTVTVNCEVCTMQYKL